MQFTDQLGTSHTFEKQPVRIVSLVPSQTELLYDLGLEDNIVGITKFCVHPVHFKATKTIVGGTKNRRVCIPNLSRWHTEVGVRAYSLIDRPSITRSG